MNTTWLNRYNINTLKDTFESNTKGKRIFNFRTFEICMLKSYNIDDKLDDVNKLTIPEIERSKSKDRLFIERSINKILSNDSQNSTMKLKRNNTR